MDPPAPACSARAVYSPSGSGPGVARAHSAPERVASAVWTAVPEAAAPAYTRTTTVLESAAPVRAVPENEGWLSRIHEPLDGRRMARVPAGPGHGGGGLVTAGGLPPGATGAPVRPEAEGRARAGADGGPARRAGRACTVYAPGRSGTGDGDRPPPRHRDERRWCARPGPWRCCPRRAAPSRCARHRERGRRCRPTGAWCRGRAAGHRLGHRHARRGAIARARGGERPLPPTASTGVARTTASRRGGRRGRIMRRREPLRSCGDGAGPCP